jgi:hypothetical protein
MGKVALADGEYINLGTTEAHYISVQKKQFILLTSHQKPFYLFAKTHLRL